MWSGKKYLIDFIHQKVFCWYTSTIYIFFLVSEWSWLSQEELTMGMIEEIDDSDVEECPLPYKVEKGYQTFF